MADSQSETQQSQPSHQGVCPFCKEEIKADAVRCSHCGANVGPSGWRMLPRGRRPVRCLPRKRTSSDRVDAPDVPPDSFTGPSLAGWRGSPAPSWRAPWTRDDRASSRLWATAEELTGVTYDALKV